MTYEFFLSIVHPDDRQYVDTCWAAGLRGDPYDIEHRIVVGGKVKWVREKAYLELDSEGVLLGGFGVTQDITDRKRAEAALRESEERYRTLSEENARLYRQQLEIANSLQHALLSIPSEVGGFKVGHLYHSATEAARVGGDFYDLFRLRDGKIGILIGDVAGHGVEAAQSAVLTRDAIHAFAHLTLKPDESFGHANRLLLDDSPQRFVTLFLGIFDPGSRTLHYASAGHPSTYLRRESGEVVALGEGSLPLGILPGSSWESHTIGLEKGDLLLLYTDGVIEARSDSRFFGEERLQALLRQKSISAPDLPQTVLNQVLAFSGGVLLDDIAILALGLDGGDAGPERSPRKVRGATSR
jgi:serine phosphatase RsbU (regulator of sigma subunit)